MKPQTTILTTLAVLAIAGGSYWLLPGKPAPAPAISPAEGPTTGHAENDDHGHTEEGEHHDEQTSIITDEAAKAAGIETATAGPAKLAERLPLRGKIILNPETSAEVKARFPGIVKSVRKTVGQQVTKGETLATVESNDSLQTYAVTSPLAGVVLSRTANIGDTAADQPMFTIANLATVTAELHVFPKDLSRVHAGQPLQVQSVDGAIEGSGIVKSLLPTTDADTQTVKVWVTLENAEHRWRSGMAVQADAIIGQEDVALAVKTSALQTLDNKTVIFVKEGTSYTAHPVTTGQTDGTLTEITQGLEPDAVYVTKNSFIIKADIGKSEAGHEH